MKRRKSIYLMCAFYVFWTCMGVNMLFVDCIHPVLKEDSSVYSKQETEKQLSEEDYIRLFRMDQDDYKITFKLDIRKWLRRD